MTDHSCKKLLTVHEVSELTGVSVRTLHFYHEKGLLYPAVTTDAGYRMYDDTNLERLQDIMLFRELEFPLKDIKTILDNPGFDREKALADQIRLLELKREHLDELIRFANGLQKKGERTMSFDAFDKKKIETYQKAAKEQWGHTEAYKEFEGKDAAKTEPQKNQEIKDFMDIFREFGELMHLDPSDPTVQAQVDKLQNFITEHYYKCTDQILAGLGQMYAAGGEMTDNIDAAGGKGCAVFTAKAIAAR